MSAHDVNGENAHRCAIDSANFGRAFWSAHKADGKVCSVRESTRSAQTLCGYLNSAAWKVHLAISFTFSLSRCCTDTVLYGSFRGELLWATSACVTFVGKISMCNFYGKHSEKLLSRPPLESPMEILHGSLVEGSSWKQWGAFSLIGSTYKSQVSFWKAFL